MLRKFSRLLGTNEVRKALALCVCAAALTVTTAINGQTTPSISNQPTYLHTIDPDGITMSIRTGDSAKLQALTGATLPSVVHEYALAGYYRSIFQINKSIEYAQACYSDALRQLPHTAVEAVRCGELLAGNYSILGDTDKWAQTMQHMRDDLYAIAVNSLHDSNIIFPSFGTASERIDMRSFFNFPSEGSIPSVGTNVVIPRVLASGGRVGPRKFKTRICALGIRCFGFSLYYIKAVINGRHVLAVIDTGAVLSNMPRVETDALSVQVNQSPYSLLSG